MTTQTTTQKWLHLPTGLYISADSMQKDGKFFSLNDAANMDVATFNKEAAEYYIQIDDKDAPIDRLVKYSIFLSRKEKDNSRMFSNEGYVDMLLDAAANKEREPFKSFYNALKATHIDATTDILEFHGKVSEGSNKNKYEVKLLRFDEDGNLQPIDEILVAPEGWTAIIGAKRKYPIETSRNFCRIQNIDITGLEDVDASGRWYIGSEPEKGEQRIALRGPRWLDGGLLGAGVDGGRSCSSGGVGALRSRCVIPSDYQAEITKLRIKARKLKNGIDAVQNNLAELTKE